MLTQQELREYLHYDCDTGVFIWIKKPSRCTNVGAVAGNQKRSGHIRIKLFEIEHMAHRLAWLYVHGVWPDGYIDHKNGKPSDNRISNLRIATPSQNVCNAKVPTRNKSGYKGVSWDRTKQKWKASIGHQGRMFHIGMYHNPVEAHAAYCAEAFRLHGEFARTS